VSGKKIIRAMRRILKPDTKVTVVLRDGSRHKMPMRKLHAFVQEHGAKNGGGYWGKRVDAKTKSKKLRRRRDDEVIMGAHYDAWSKK
jgi:hypothetical protein